MDVYNKNRLERQNPTFGSWEGYEGIPFTCYFESANQRLFRHYSYSCDSDRYHCTYSAATPFQTSQRIAGQEKGSKERWAEAGDLQRFPRTRAALSSLTRSLAKSAIMVLRRSRDTVTLPSSLVMLSGSSGQAIIPVMVRKTESG